MGWLTMEELVWHPKTGLLTTHAPSTYKIPTPNDCPPVFDVRLFHADNPAGHHPPQQGRRRAAIVLLPFSVFYAIRDLVSAVGNHRVDPPLSAPATAGESDPACDHGGPGRGRLVDRDVRDAALRARAAAERRIVVEVQEGARLWCRGVGTRMLVLADACCGTIGGGDTSGSRPCHGTGHARRAGSRIAQQALSRSGRPSASAAAGGDAGLHAARRR